MSKVTGEQVVAQIPRNILLGILIMFTITSLGATLGGLDFVQALAVAALPAFVAGPFVGGMITMASYQHVEDHE